MKGAPWHPRIDAYDSWDSFSKEDVEYLAYLNINLIRLGVMWPGVEPERGVYNTTYLDVIGRIIEMCREKVRYLTTYVGYAPILATDTNIQREFTSSLTFIKTIYRKNSVVKGSQIGQQTAQMPGFHLFIQRDTSFVSQCHVCEPSRDELIITHSISIFNDPILKLL
jgi:hypothetical protein